MRRVYYKIGRNERWFSTLRAVRMWLYNMDISERFDYDTCIIRYCRIGFLEDIPFRQIHVHPITGEVYFSKVV